MPYVLLTYIFAVAVVALLLSSETLFGLGLGIVLLAVLIFGIVGLRRRMEHEVDDADREHEEEFRELEHEEEIRKLEHEALELLARDRGRTPTGVSSEGSNPVHRGGAPRPESRPR